MSFASHALHQALTPKKHTLIAPLLLILGLIICISAAAYGYIESRRTEPVVIAARDIPYGRQIVADDLAVIEVPLYRPIQIAGLSDPNVVIGSYAARTIGPNDIVQPTMLLPRPPDDPVYPNGAQLHRDMVPVPFALQALGPITDRDRVNIGFTTSDSTLCDRQAADVAPGMVLPAPVAQVGDPPVSQRAFACRFMARVPILYIDGSTAYLEMTPAQAHAMWALTAAGVQVWGERYGAQSTPLLAMDRLDAAQITIPDITLPVSQTIRIEPSRSLPIPGSTIRIPGTTTVLPGTAPLVPTVGPFNRPDQP